jgi:hypothetical protein
MNSKIQTPSKFEEAAYDRWAKALISKKFGSQDPKLVEMLKLFLPHNSETRISAEAFDPIAIPSETTAVRAVSTFRYDLRRRFEHIFPGVLGIDKTRPQQYYILSEATADLMLEPSEQIEIVRQALIDAYPGQTEIETIPEFTILGQTILVDPSELRQEPDLLASLELSFDHGNALLEELEQQGGTTSELRARLSFLRELEVSVGGTLQKIQSYMSSLEEQASLEEGERNIAKIWFEKLSEHQQMSYLEAMLRDHPDIYSLKAAQVLLFILENHLKGDSIVTTTELNPIVAEPDEDHLNLPQTTRSSRKRRAVSHLNKLQEGLLTRDGQKFVIDSPKADLLLFKIYEKFQGEQPIDLDQLKNRSLDDLNSNEKMWIITWFLRSKNIQAPWTARVIVRLLENIEDLVVPSTFFDDLLEPSEPRAPKLTTNARTSRRAELRTQLEILQPGILETQGSSGRGRKYAFKAVQILALKQEIQALIGLPTPKPKPQPIAKSSDGIRWKPLPSLDQPAFVGANARLDREKAIEGRRRSMTGARVGPQSTLGKYLRANELKAKEFVPNEMHALRALLKAKAKGVRYSTTTTSVQLGLNSLKIKHPELIVYDEKTNSYWLVEHAPE